MKTDDGKCWCDWCAVELIKDARNGLLISKTMDNGIVTCTRSVRCLFGVRLCAHCFKSIERKEPKTKPNANVMRYVRAVESGKKTPPFTMAIRFGDRDRIHREPLKVKG